MEFCHLHLHTKYSLLNGVCKIDEIAEKLKEIGQQAAAITDHGNMFGAFKFYERLKKNGIKAIIGCEIYLDLNFDEKKKYFIDDSIFHLVLLCENRVGYENLVKIVSHSHLEGFFKVPRVGLDFLLKHKKGLIVLSGCKKGEVAQKILKKDYELAKRVVLKYKHDFGVENFFLELQNFGSQEDEFLKENLVKLSFETGVQLVATNNVHYIKKEDKFVKDIVFSIKNFKTLEKDLALKGAVGEKFLKSYEEMKPFFKGCEEALKRTVEIANRCEFNFEFGLINIPKYESGEEKSSKDFLIKKAREGLLLKYGENPEKRVFKRFLYELKVIVKMGFVDYFLIVFDYVQYAKKTGIFVGPGRGSGAGSLVGFCLGITEVDPIKFELSFERFLNIYRTKMPDFDVDFCNERRQEVIDYVIRKYGQQRVARIITFGTLAAKAALKDVGRILGFSYDFVEFVVKKIPGKIGITLEEVLEQSDFLKSFVEENEDAKILFQVAKKVEGLIKNTSIHAAALVMTKENLTSFIPLYKAENNIITTQYAMGDIEKLNLLKMDFLGLRNLTVMSWCEKLINKKDENFKVLNIDLNDEKTFKMLAVGDSVGVFQLESIGMRNVLKKVSPSCLEDVMAVLALNRPGPSQFIDEYVKNKKNPKNIKYSNKIMEKILKRTYGVIIYQEQVMEIFEKVAGYSLKNIDNVRKAISKKDFEYMKNQGSFFVYGRKDEDLFLNCDGALKRGFDEQGAIKIFNSLLKFSFYSFNKAHAASYSIISYKTAYLKCNFLLEYMVCLLNSVLDNKDKLKVYLKECEIKKIKILPININKSDKFFKIEGDFSIRFCFLAIKNVSESLIDAVVKERQEGDFSSFEDFLKRVARVKEKEFSKTSVLSLVYSGAFSEFLDSKDVLENLENIFEEMRFKKREIEGQISLFENFNNEKVKVKGRIKNIEVKVKNSENIFVLTIESGRILKKIFIKDERFTNFLKILKVGDFLSLNATEILKNGEVFLVFEDVLKLQIKRVLVVNFSKRCYEVLLNVMKKKKGEDFLLFYEKEKEKFFRNNALKRVLVDDELILNLKKTIGEKNFNIKNFIVDNIFV